MDKYKEKSKEHYQKNKDRIKKYKEDNKDKTVIQRKKYYDKSKKNICIICGKPANDKFCSDKCMGIGISGKKHPQWKGGKSFDPYPITWTERLRRKIRKRDAYLCMMCSRHQDEFNRSHDVHHIDGDKDNCDKENLITLCRRHHAIVESSGGKKYTFWMPKFQKMLSKLYSYKYV